MKKLVLAKADPLFLKEENIPQVLLDGEDYLQRLRLLRKSMSEDGLDVAVIYGDREHFANIEYFSGYDCRFEEGLLIVPKDGRPSLLVGNEGMAYSHAIPYDIGRIWYRNFSLQGQPRNAKERLDEILKGAGIVQGTRVGVIGFKYFYAEYCGTDPAHTFDLPHYVTEALFAAAGRGNVLNFTRALTGLDRGLRLQVRSAKEIAKAEAAAARSSGVLLRMLKHLRPGITEYELGEEAKAGFGPWTMFPLTNFGARSVSIGLKSPRDDTRLELGDVCGLAYGVRGSLSARVGVASYDQRSMKQELQPHLFPFYGGFFRAMCAWYETLRVGASGDALHRAVHDLIGESEFGVDLNAGHFTGMDEWTNSLSFEASPHTVPDGAYMQADIIASNPDPVRTAICEDPVIVAGEALRKSLQEQHPAVWARIAQRRSAMRRQMGISLSEDVLPLSNINGVMFPFMLNLDVVFALEG